VAIAAQPKKLKGMISNLELVLPRNYTFVLNQSSLQNDILRLAATEANDVVVVVIRTHLVSLLSIAKRNRTNDFLLFQKKDFPVDGRPVTLDLLLQKAPLEVSH
jgi:hypothetical protein